MIVQTVELGGEALNHAVGKALGWTDYPTDSVERGSVWHLDLLSTPFGRVMNKSRFNPSTDWADAGPILEKMGIWVQMYSENSFCARQQAEEYYDIGYQGKSYLEAGMRCFVVAKLGGVVDIPDELLNQG